MLGGDGYRSRSTLRWEDEGRPKISVTRGKTSRQDFRGWAGSGVGGRESTEKEVKSRVGIEGLPREGLIQFRGEDPVARRG